MGVPLWLFVWTQHTTLSPVPRVSPLAGQEQEQEQEQKQEQEQEQWQEQWHQQYHDEYHRSICGISSICNSVRTV